jgi:positive regulator of sigma E activity
MEVVLFIAFLAALVASFVATILVHVALGAAIFVLALGFAGLALSWEWFVQRWERVDRRTRHLTQ